MKKIIQFFEKIGMLRTGWGAGVYKNAKDAPDQVVFDGTTYKSPKQLKKEHQAQNSQGKGKKPGKKCCKVGASFWVLLAVAIAFELLFLAGSGFSFWFLLSLAVWFFFFRYLSKSLLPQGASLLKVIFLFIGALIVSFVLLGLAGTSEEGVGSGSTGGASGKDLAKLDGKVLKVSSEDGTVSGQIGLKYDKGDYISVYYHLFVNEALAENKVCFTCKQNPKFDNDCRSWDKYNYAGRIMGSDKLDEYNVSYSLMPIFCGERPSITDPAGMNKQGMNMGCFDKQVGKDLTTNMFYFGTMTSVKSLQDVLDADQFLVFDGQDYVVRDSCVDGDVGSSLEEFKASEAVQSGKPLKEFKLNIKE